MAQVVLYGRDELVREAMPDCCVCCGAHASKDIFKRFSWAPPWVYLLAALPPLLIVFFIWRRRMNAYVPACDKHRSPWRKQTVASIVMVLLLVVLYYVVAGPGEIRHDGGNPGDIWDLLKLGWLVAFLVATIISAVVHNR